MVLIFNIPLNNSKMEMTTQSEITIDTIPKPLINLEEIATLKEKNDFESNVLIAYQSLQNKSTHPNATLSKQSDRINAILKYLITATEVMNNKDQPINLNTSILDKLNRISSHGICFQIHIGKIYVELLKQKEMILSLPSSLITSFINQVLHLVAMIKTTSIEYELEKKADEFITELTNTNKLNQEQLDGLKQFIEENPSNFKKIKSKQIDFSSFQPMLASLNEILKKINTNEEQYLLFIGNTDKFIQIIKKAPIDDYDSYDYYIEYGNFLLYLFYFNETIVIYHTEQENESPNVISYVNFNEEDLSFINRVTFYVVTSNSIQSLKKQLLPLALAYIERFSTCNQSFECLLICFVLLRRLYALYPDQHNKLSNLLVNTTFILCTFKQDQTEECRLLIKNIKDYSGNIDYMIELKSLFIQKENEVKDKKEYELQSTVDIKRDKPFGIDGMYILDYDTKLGYFNQIEVLAGEVFDYYIEVVHPYSLVDFCFLIEDFDVNVSLHYSTFSDNLNSFKLLKLYERIDQFDTPKKILLFMNEPCIIKVSFDNSYSWINSKEIRYKVNVLKASNLFEITQKIAIENLSTLISNEDNINTSLTHLNKAVSFRFDQYTRDYNIGRLYNNIMKYNRLIEKKIINPTYPLFIKNNIFWESNREKDRKQLNQEAFDDIIVNSIIDKDKLTIVNLINMANEDKAMTNDIEELLKFTPKYFGEKVLFVKGNYVHSSIIYHIYQCIVEKKRVTSNILYIHSGGFGMQLCLYRNEYIKNIEELNAINDLTSIDKQARAIIDYINTNINNKSTENKIEKEIIEIVLSGISSQVEELSNIFFKENWGNSLDTIITIKKKPFMEGLIQESPFFLFIE